MIRTYGEKIDLHMGATDLPSEAVCDGYRRSEPFPHFCFDNFLPDDLLDNVLSEISSSGRDQWDDRFDVRGPSLRKRSLHDREAMGPYTNYLVNYLNSPLFLPFLEELTGIGGIIPDPYLIGGGIHQIDRGGYLKIHADFNWHQGLGLYRRLNILLFLNKDWKEEYGGHLELWDRNMENCSKRFLPIWNRMVVFTVDEKAFHGHPEPIKCPRGMMRRSLALYYYTSNVPDATAESDKRIGATWYRRPKEKDYHPNRGIGKFVPPILRQMQDSPRSVLSQFSPPVLLDCIRKFSS